MKIEIKQPNPDFPLAWVHATTDYKKDPEKLGFDIAMVLAEQRVTLLGLWETVSIEGTIVVIKAPALLEDQHIKPAKKRRK
jgi:hypothetical protein